MHFFQCGIYTEFWLGKCHKIVCDFYEEANKEFKIINLQKPKQRQTYVPLYKSDSMCKSYISAYTDKYKIQWFVFVACLTKMQHKIIQTLNFSKTSALGRRRVNESADTRKGAKG